MERKMIYQDDAIDAIVGCTNCGTEDELRAYVTRHSLEDVWSGGIVDALDAIEQLPSAQPDVHDTNVGDTIYRQAAIDKFIDELDEIFADLRERHVDDSVCGLCEYDGAYLGQSGDWCNECPGFEKDDCFKLSGEIRKEWTDKIIKAVASAQPDATDINVGGTIYRQAAIDAMCGACSDWCDEGVCRKVSAIQKLPSAQPIDVQEAYYRGKIDGIKECTARLKKMNEEFANG